MTTDDRPDGADADGVPSDTDTGQGRLTIGEVAHRAGVTTSTLRFYEQEGLVHATRTAGNQRRYEREVLRRVAFVRIAQRVGVPLQEIREALATLPEARTPTPDDWDRLASAWHDRLTERIALLVGLRDDLSSCIGCGCLSLRTCHLYNPSDAAAALGDGPRYLLGDSAADVIGRPGAGIDVAGAGVTT